MLKLFACIAMLVLTLLTSNAQEMKVGVGALYEPMHGLNARLWTGVIGVDASFLYGNYSVETKRKKPEPVKLLSKGRVSDYEIQLAVLAKLMDREKSDFYLKAIVGFGGLKLEYEDAVFYPNEIKETRGSFLSFGGGVGLECFLTNNWAISVDPVLLYTTGKEITKTTEKATGDLITETETNIRSLLIPQVQLRFNYYF